jgi:hypothetical protein
VKLTGKRIDSEQYRWLIGPIGDTDRIGDKFIEGLANESSLQIISNQTDVGLLESIRELGLSDQELKSIKTEIVDFYEKTSNYEFEFWSEWCGLLRPFGWLLSILFSKRLHQLNLPLSSMDSSKGINSQILKLHANSKTSWTIWYRTLKANKRVIYAGIYTTCRPSTYNTPLLKVIFPLPNGNASVIMTKSVGSDGSLMLSSDGKKFGQNGFYFYLTDKNGKHWAKYVRAMHEWIRVYVDEDKILRADHNLDFYGLRFLNLHLARLSRSQQPVHFFTKIDLGNMACTPTFPSTSCVIFTSTAMLHSM